MREQVSSAVCASLFRVVGGGHALPKNINNNNSPADAPSAQNKNEWVEELKRIASNSVSFPNGTSSSNSVDGSAGKPHDVEVRAALMLYHRIRRVYYCNHSIHHADADEDDAVKKGKRKRKQPKSEIKDGDLEFDVISDFGTQRRITSVRSLANLLTIELEKELCNNNIISAMAEDEAASTTTTFTDIRSDTSGIICLISKQRSQQLQAAGRLPCPYCIKWCKKAKGLWWHQLQAHGAEYSSATENAQNEMNTLSIVPYQEGSSNLLQVLSETHRVKDDDKGQSDNIMIPKERDAFDMVKEGKYNEFITFIEEMEFSPETQLDAHGASVLHWAAGCGHSNLVSYLIEKCNCCANSCQKGKRSFRGRTPLHWAARNGHLNVVQYLVTTCKVDIDATTSDGTTAFCWASWQGHLSIMKYLHESGCDIHSINSFGCNAVLWSAQGAGTSDTLAWFSDIGLDMQIINSNGHGALHKAAQRGSENAVKWLVSNMLLHDENVAMVMLHPDNEGHMPSDLCGMEGHECLALWLSKQEFNCIMGSVFGTATSLDNLILKRCPSWLKQDLLKEKSHSILHNTNSSNTCWGPGCGVKRIAEKLVEHLTVKQSANEEVTAEVVYNDSNDID